MILKFFEHGKGNGKSAIDYVYSDEDHAKNVRPHKPETVKGNPKTLFNLINNCPHEYKYVSGMLRFTREEFTEEVAAKALQSFEEAAFAGLDPHQYELLIVRHEEDDNVHFHFLTVRMELTTGKSYNINPEGAAYGFWRDWSALTRHELGLKEPPSIPPLDKLPLNSKERKLIAKGLLSRMPHTEIKLDIDASIRANIANGLLTNRRDVIHFLEANGFEIAEVKTGSISIKTGEQQDGTKPRNIRLSGAIYDNTTDHGKTYTAIASENNIGLNAENASPPGHHKQANGGIDKSELRGFQQRADAIWKGRSVRFKAALERRKAYCSNRYGRPRSNYLEKDTGLLRFLPRDGKGRTENVQVAVRNTPSADVHSLDSNSNKGMVKTTNTNDGRIQQLTALLASTTDPVKKAELLAQLGSLQNSKADDFVSTMTSRGRGYSI
ncbi:MAG: hypothetical protein EON54_03420 [Alcaligenaceae bacterium]|nr:MAG: hypothetical protein EON54_03420 [Alcaligenaceae bacterium]